MARFKPAGRPKKPAGRQRPNAVGCITILVLAFLALFWMMYMTIRQG